MPILRNYSSIAQPTTLSGSISAGATSINVGATTGFPSTPFTLALDYGAATEELVDVTAVAGTTLTVTRGVDGTSAQSHSLGANVRHVISARDLADYQAHQAATAAVHGVTGTLVGTSDAQTLGNKTLTSPIINAGALSGTFTGAPTLSGAPSFSGNPSFTGSVTFNGPAAPSFQRATAANTALKAMVTGDAQDRFQVAADGKILWGPGSAAQDTVLYREAADILTTDDTVRVYRPTTASDAFQARVTGDTLSRLNIDADGGMAWGPGGAVAQDTTLYRSAAGALKTDGSLEAVGNLIGANFTPGASIPYTCTFTAATTNPTLGTGGTLVSMYSLRGKWCLVEITLTFGSFTASAGSGAWSFSLPFTAASRNVTYIGNAQALGSSGSQRFLGQVVVSSGATNASPYFPTNSTTIAAAVASNSVPFGAGNWGSTDQCRMTFEYEIA